MFALLFRFGVIPMTLFAGVFFPVESLPLVLRWLAYASPLWHGVELCRAATLGVAPRGRPGATSRYLLALVRRSGCGWPGRRFRQAASSGVSRWSPRCAAPAGRPSRAPAAGRASRGRAQRARALRHVGYWLVLVSGFFEPLLYLLSIGVGVGALVGDFPLADGRMVGYAAFVAPAMLAASAMNGALAETTFNFFCKMKYMKLYDAMLATPVRPIEIALGELIWAMVRGAVYSVAFLVVMVAMELTSRVAGAGRVPGDDAGGVRVRRARHGAVDVHARLAGLRLRDRRPSSRCSCSPGTFAPVQDYHWRCGAGRVSARSTTRST